MKTLNFILLIACFTTILYSCKSDADSNTPVLEVPKFYEATSFASNSSSEKAALAELKALVDELKKGRNASVTLTEATLLELYNGKNIKTQTTSYYQPIVVEGLKAAAAASGKTYTPSATSEGGVLNGYLFDPKGLESEQLVEKGLFGAALVRTAFSLLDQQPVSSAAVDRALAVIGGNPTFPNTNTAAEGRTPDAFFMTYGARRSDTTNPNNLYNQLKRAFIKAQAASKNPSTFAKQYNEAVSEIKLTLEKINAATAINYCFSTNATLSQTNVTDAQKGSALHALGEAIGFVHGWKTVPGKKITDAQIDEVLALMNYPNSCYLFATEPFANLPKLLTAVDKLKAIYGFSDAEIESFKKNWINEQKR
jgi:hypothetical protein